MDFVILEPWIDDETIAACAVTEAFSSSEVFRSHKDKVLFLILLWQLKNNLTECYFSFCKERFYNSA